MTKEQATREALEMALEALETNNKAWKNLADSGDAGFWEAEEQPFYEIAVKAIIAIKEALSSPNGEAQRKPLTREVIERDFHGRVDFVRRVEAAHGIKENT